MFNRKDHLVAPAPFKTPDPLFQKPPLQQEQSGFLSKLPLEIRIAIYKQVFGYGPIHLTDKGQRLIFTRCQTESQGDLWDGHQKCMEPLSATSEINMEEQKLFALCRTCRRM